MVDKLFTDINTILFLIFIEQAWHKFGCNVMPVQIFSVNLMTCSFWNSGFLCYFMNSQMTTGANHTPNLIYVFFIFWCWRLSWTFITLNWSLALFKTFVPLRGCVILMVSSPNTCFNVSKVSENVFPNLKQNFTQTCCLWKITYS